MYSTQYPNNSRTVSGNVSLYDDDVVLLCDNFTAPVTINLQQIPYEHWSTTWKLYIVDKTNRAGTNNITIEAGLGQTINGASSITINFNGGVAIVWISSNTTYSALINSSANLSAGYTRIQDEGTNLPLRNILNFIGDNVVVTDDPTNSRTNVTISGLGIVYLTNVEMLALQTAGTVVPGQFYMITDGGNSDGGVLVQGTTTKSSTVNGAGIFLNADYQGVGRYTSVPTYNVFKGIWSPNALSVAVGDIVVYNNLNYLNLTGLWGDPPNADTTNWIVLTKSVTKGYIIEIDVVRYDVENNIIKYRADKRGNEVDYYVASVGISTEVFQWGRALVTGNKVLSGSYMNCLNSSATFTNNSLFGASIQDNTSTTSPGVFIGNVLMPSAYIQVAENQGQLNRNRLIGNETYIAIPTIGASCRVDENELVDASSISTTLLDGLSYITLNKLDASSSISISVKVDTSSYISKCILSAGSQIAIDEISASAYIAFCTLINSSIISSLGSSRYLQGGYFDRCYMLDAQYYFENITGSLTKCEIQHTTISIQNLSVPYENYSYRIGFSNWPYEISCAAMGTSFVIPAGKHYVGVFTLINCSGKSFSNISGAGIQTNHPFTLKPREAFAYESFNITPIAVAVSAVGDIIANAYTSGSAVYTPRNTGSDYAVLFTAYPECYGLIEKNVWY